MLKHIPIAVLKIGPRHRKDMGDLTTLAESIRQSAISRKTRTHGKSSTRSACGLFNPMNRLTDYQTTAAT